MIRIGTCGYSYPGLPPKGWHGVFYPRKSGRRVDELEFYAEFFDTVEINSTFYRPPAPGMAAAWAKKTPSDFEFAVKVWQKFTHSRKLGETSEPDNRWEPPDAADVDNFMRGIQPLAESGKLGVLLFQYPPAFQYGAANMERLEWTLQAFGKHPKVVELRHRSWSDHKNETLALLQRFRSAWAFIDEPKFASSVRQEFEATGDVMYCRLHGRNYEKWWKHEEAWERYDYFYRPEELLALADRLSGVARKRPETKAYVLFNNHARGQAVANALLLKAMLGQTMALNAPPALLEAFPRK